MGLDQDIDQQRREQDEQWARWRKERVVGMLAWRAFPRSAGIISAELYIAIALQPLTALGIGLGVWVILYFVKRILPDPYDRRMWSCCYVIVLPATFWAVKWIIAIVCYLVGTLRGAPVVPTLVVLGVLLLYDTIILFTFGS